MRTASNPTTSINVTLAYNKLSQPATITYGTNNNVRTLTYDDLHRLKTDTLKNAAGTVTLGSITYGYDANGNETSKVTTGFAGSASNTYTYDLADRLTSWSNGTTSTTYAYDASGNRTQNGSKTFTYDARNQLLTQNDGSSYLYTARGTLKRTMSGSAAYDTLTDAFGQVRSQQAAGGVTTSYDYDALGRAIKPGFTYTGLGNHRASDGTATYTRGPAGELFGVGSGAGAGSRYAWTDQHWDVVGQFSATGTALSGSTTYDPLGSVLTTSGMVGHLGYQSEWTDGLTVRDGETGKTTVLKTTQHHPFWDATDGRWVDAGKLAVGHRLRVHDDKRLEGDGTGAGMGGGGPGHQLTVVEVRNYTGDKRMHDLTVADIHTYY
ncbi:HINT domain-containing protein [Micromonospora olivasterospora]|uniref:YD repeat-containing protein n=1 Tax=Micromonospora olivasterospora TaxID=1880 RepID=A0A562I2F9_MICOL|nr:YD repeat-containing protein [Micromonospora olivasterospora]